MRDMVRNKERCKRRRTPTQDPSTVSGPRCVSVSHPDREHTLPKPGASRTCFTSGLPHTLARSQSKLWVLTRVGRILEARLTMKVCNCIYLFLKNKKKLTPCLLSADISGNISGILRMSACLDQPLGTPRDKLADEAA